MAGDASGMISNWAGGGASVTLGAAQYLIGKRGEKKNKRPEYQAPGEINQNLSQAETMALEGLPEEQKQQYLSNLERGSAFGLSQLGGRNAGIAGVAALNENQNQAQFNLMSADAQARQQNQNVLMQQRQNVANYKDQAFQFNKVDPYYENVAKNNALMGAGMQNVSQGFQSSNSGYDWGSGSNGGGNSGGSQFSGYGAQGYGGADNFYGNSQT